MAAESTRSTKRVAWWPSTHTPVRATLVAGGIVLLLALALPLVGLAKTTSAIVLCVFTLINLSLLRIKWREPRPADVRVVPEPHGPGLRVVIRCAVATHGRGRALQQAVSTQIRVQEPLP